MLADLHWQLPKRSTSVLDNPVTSGMIPYLSSKVGSTALRHLKDERSFLVPGGLERCDDS